LDYEKIALRLLLLVLLYLREKNQYLDDIQQWHQLVYLVSSKSSAACIFPRRPFGASLSLRASATRNKHAAGKHNPFMSSKLVEDIEQVTQSVEAVVELLKYLGRPTSPIPEAIEMPDMMLVLNGKKNAFYITTPKSCSCPSSTYRPGKQCKHQRRYFPEPKKTQVEIEALAETEQLLSAKWFGGFNGPVGVD
jgi:hypothetical protein